MNFYFNKVLDKIMRKILFLLCIYVVVSCSSSNASDFNILGIELGMSPAEIESILKESNYKVVPLKVALRTRYNKQIPNTEHVYFIDARPMDNKVNDAVFIYFAAPPNDNVVSFIIRNNNFYTDAPSQKNLLKALEEKYNKPTYIQKDRDFTWSVSESQAPPCLLWNNPFNDSMSNLNNKGINKLISGECGLTLNIRIDQRNGIVKRVKTRLFDSDALKIQRDFADKFMQDYEEKVQQEKLQKANSATVPKL